MEKFEPMEAPAPEVLGFKGEWRNLTRRTHLHQKFWAFNKGEKDVFGRNLNRRRHRHQKFRAFKSAGAFGESVMFSGEMVSSQLGLR